MKNDCKRALYGGASTMLAMAVVSWMLSPIMPYVFIASAVGCGVLAICLFVIAINL